MNSFLGFHCHEHRAIKKEKSNKKYHTSHLYSCYGKQYEHTDNVFIFALYFVLMLKFLDWTF